MRSNQNRFGPKKGFENSVSANSRYRNRSGYGMSAPGGNLMSRGQFGKILGLGAAGIAAAGMGLGGIARAEAPPPGCQIDDPNGDQSLLVVYPSGIAPYYKSPPGIWVIPDRDCVQWAVDNVATGGTILLKAAMRDGTRMYFDFKKDTEEFPANPAQRGGNVRVTKNVTILGEPCAPQAFAFPGVTPDYSPLPDGTAVVPDRTVIFGGWKPFYLDTTSPGPSIPPSLTVRNVYFAYPGQAAVYMEKCSGLEVSNCVVFDIFESDTLRGISDFFSVPMEATAIDVTGLFVWQPGQPNPNLTGNFSVLNNVIKRRTEQGNPDCFGAPTKYGFNDRGIALLAASMNANISGNRLYNFPSAGIEVDANTGSSAISGNTIYACGFGGYQQPLDCLNIPFPFPAGIRARRSATPIVIEANEIACVPELGGSQFLEASDGIFLEGATGVIVRSNTLSGHALGSSLGMWAITDENMEIVWPSGQSSILGNNARGLQADGAQVYMLMSDNNELKNNDWGPVLRRAGSYVNASSNNVFVNENFWGDYPGIYLEYPGQVMDLFSRLPCMWFLNNSTGNTVSALKNGQSLQGFDLCTQIFFSRGSSPDNNIITGYSKCGAVPPEVVNAMMAKEEQIFQEACAGSGGTWDASTKRCICSEGYEYDPFTGGCKKV